LFSSSPESFKNLKNPGHFTYEWDVDYWKLYYELGGDNKPPKVPHKTLGWVGNFNRESYFHVDGEKVGRRRPVLLYGDSFSACVDEVDCFEDILNKDTAFTKDNYLLNYGVGGYGVCQASLLCRKTAPHYQKPLVVFGLLTTDLERTILPVRTGQKPYYDLEDEQLVLKGLPIDSVPTHYFEENPASTRSYLFSLFLHSKLNFLPYRVSTWFTEKEKSIEKIQKVNGLLIKHLAAELRAKDIDFVFLIFHFEDDMMSPKSEDNWRDQFLKKTMADNQLPYIWSKAIIREHRKAHPDNKHETYIIPGNGHPTTLYNQLISDEIKRIALENPRPLDYQPDTTNQELYATRVLLRAKAILRDSVGLQFVREKAIKNNRPLETQLFMESTYLMNIELDKEKPFAPDGVFEGKWK
jgi:hypothetical protein